jgi:hypothetical protein
MSRSNWSMISSFRKLRWTHSCFSQSSISCDLFSICDSDRSISSSHCSLKPWLPTVVLGDRLKDMSHDSRRGVCYLRVYLYLVEQCEVDWCLTSRKPGDNFRPRIPWHSQYLEKSNSVKRIEMWERGNRFDPDIHLSRHAKARFRACGEINATFEIWAESDATDEEIVKTKTRHPDSQPENRTPEAKKIAGWAKIWSERCGPKMTQPVWLAQQNRLPHLS